MPTKVKCDHSGAIVFIPTEEEKKVSELEDKNRELENRLARMEKLLLENKI